MICQVCKREDPSCGFYPMFIEVRDAKHQPLTSSPFLCHDCDKALRAGTVRREFVGGSGSGLSSHNPLDAYGGGRPCKIQPLGEQEC